MAPETALRIAIEVLAAHPELLERWLEPRSVTGKVSGYVELPSDHAFTAFLAGLTPSKVLRDRSALFSRVERKRQRFLVEKARLEFEVFTQRQLQGAGAVIDGGKEA